MRNNFTKESVDKIYNNAKQFGYNSGFRDGYKRGLEDAIEMLNKFVGTEQ